MTHTLSVLVENRPGALARVSNMFARRGFNIESLAVGPTERPNVSRITLRVALRVRRNVKRDATRRETYEKISAPEDGAPAETDHSLGARRRELLRELLEDLPEEQAEALTLRVVMGWSLEEVSSASGAPVNTVRSRVRLAKEALRARIEEQPALAELRGLP